MPHRTAAARVTAPLVASSLGAALACVLAAPDAAAQSLLPALRINATGATSSAPQAQCCPVAPPALRLEPDAAAGLLATAASAERAAREREAALALGVSLGTAGAGAALFATGQGVHLPAWTGIGVGGMMLTASLAAWFAPGRAAQLDAAVLRARRARDAASIDALERRWAALAADERAQRLALGVGGSATAVALGAAAAATLLADRAATPQGASDAPRLAAGALLGASAATVLGWSLSTLLRAGPLETSLAAWRRGGPSRRPVVVRPWLQVAPQFAPGEQGALVVVGGAF